MHIDIVRRLTSRIEAKTQQFTHRIDKCNETPNDNKGEFEQKSTMVKSQQSKLSLTDCHVVATHWSRCDRVRTKQ